MVFLGHPFEFLDCKSAEENETPILVETPVEFLDCKSAEGSETSILESSRYDHNGSSTAICDHDQYLRDKLGENSAEMGSTRITMERKKLEDFLKELDVFENMAWSGTVEEKKTEPKGKKIHKAKDWKRTLACKFYEERHNASDSTGEEMDLLWEKYEMDSIKNNEKRDNSNSKKKMRSYVKEEHINEHIEQLCCLQALNLSAGKKNLGMGRANFVRISRAIKGFKWLYHVSKNNKKVHCGDRF
ncbi:uncharacterized protein LOC132617926 [Lycium barbarum]|uniref:uncharacterized protein LOC132617926 n=1 Tax=Lycium barbarum TaxID=112863 RepID=UPI00293EAFA0|nr:uncharacterized protein LOC132617926 [Lycium barbarum]